ncbi:MAG: hypothetical protein HY067_03455 [Betaproteobacteria bacterium]|nr:hypothetical protein [Betaproteobacteria bacterium]
MSGTNSQTLDRPLRRYVTSFGDLMGLCELALGTRSILQQREPLATQNQHIRGDSIIHARP